MSRNGNECKPLAKGNAVHRAGLAERSEVQLPPEFAEAGDYGTQAPVS